MKTSGRLRGGLCCFGFVMVKTNAGRRSAAGCPCRCSCFDGFHARRSQQTGIERDPTYGNPVGQRPILEPGDRAPKQDAQDFRDFLASHTGRTYTAGQQPVTTDMVKVKRGGGFEMRKFINLCIFLLLPSFAMACPPGGVPIPGTARCGSPAEAKNARDAIYAPAAAPPREVWQSKYGALAGDLEAGRAGIAEDENSLRAARRVALQRCGTKNCKILATIGNGCIAAVHGGGMAGIGTGATLELAMQDARSKCPGNCEHRYAHCNNPVRIR